MQNYESEITLVDVVSLFAMVVILLLLVKQIQDIMMDSNVFPFISLTLTPLIVLYVLLIDVKLAVVVKLLIQRLFLILTFDLFDVKSRTTGKELENP